MIAVAAPHMRAFRIATNGVSERMRSLDLHEGIDLVTPTASPLTVEVARRYD